MNNLQPRERLLLIAVPFIGIVVALYLLVIAPQQQEARRLEAEVEKARQEQQRLEQLVVVRPQVEAQIQEARARIAALEGKLPEAREIPTLLLQLERAVRQSRAKIILFKPVGAPTAPTGAQPAAGQRPTTPQPPAGSQYQAFGVELGAEGDYAALQDFLRRLQDFPRLLILSEMRMQGAPQTPGQPLRPTLTMNIKATTYYLPAEARVGGQ